MLGSSGETGTDSLTVTVNAPNSAPVVDAGDPTASVAFGTAFTRSGSFSDPDDDTWTATVDWGEGAGPQPLALVGKTFALDHLYAAPGTYTVTVAVDDGETAGSDTVEVAVSAPNHKPYAVDDFVTVHGSGPTGKQVEVLRNDTDIDGDELAIVAFQDRGGKVDCGATVCTYTPTGAPGGDMFAYTIGDGRGGTSRATVHVTIRENQQPEANPDDADAHGTGPEPIPVLANDLDPEGDRLAVSLVEAPAHGSALCPDVANGCTYTPPATPPPGETYPFDITFRYRIDDGHDKSDEATVTVTVHENEPPRAVDDEATAHGTGAERIPVLANDVDPEAASLTAVLIQAPALGTAQCTDACIYTPPASPAAFTETFTYRVDDGHGGLSNAATVTVTVRANGKPVARNDTMTAPGVEAGFEPLGGTVTPLGNDSDPDGDDLGITSPSLTATRASNGEVICFRPQSGPWTCVYKPDHGFFGRDSFTYTVDDGHGDTAEARVDVLVTETTATRSSTPHRRRTVHGAVPQQPLDVLGNDGDPDDDRLRVVANTQPANGSVTCSPECVYAPPAGYSGPFPLDATFTYDVSDDRGGTATATVRVRVVENTQPVARNDRGTARFAAPAKVFVVANDYDADGDGLFFASFTQPEHGVVACGNGQCTYSAPLGFFGEESFEYTVSDGYGGQATATVHVRVVKNHAPVARPDAVDATTGRPEQVLASPTTPTRTAATSPDHRLHERPTRHGRVQRRPMRLHAEPRRERRRRVHLPDHRRQGRLLTVDDRFRERDAERPADRVRRHAPDGGDAHDVRRRRRQRPGSGRRSAPGRHEQRSGAWNCAVPQVAAPDAALQPLLVHGRRGVHGDGQLHLHRDRREVRARRYSAHRHRQRPRDRAREPGADRRERQCRRLQGGRRSRSTCS